jgi:hypothetical protein
MITLLTQDRMRVDLTVDECWRVANELPVGDRINPLNPEAKIEVFALEDSSDPELFRRSQAAKSVAQILGNDDLLLYIPRASVQWVFCSQIDFTEGDIMSRVDDEHLQAWLQRIPGQKISLYLGGALIGLDVGSFFEEGYE